MKLTDLAIGTAISIEVYRNDEVIYLKSKVHSIEDDDIVIFNLTHNGSLFSFKQRDDAIVLVSTQQGVFAWDIHHFTTQNVGSISLLRLGSREEGRNFNRRKEFRIRTLLTAMYKSQEVLVRDISFTGVSFLYSEGLSLEDNISFTLTDDGQLFPLELKVIRRDEDIDGSILYGCNIVTEPPNWRKYVMNKQSEEMRKRRHAMRG